MLIEASFYVDTLPDITFPVRCASDSINADNFLSHSFTFVIFVIILSRTIFCVDRYITIR